MKQYKLIQIYPGSPVISTKISAIGSSSVEYFDEKSRFVISRPNEHPEFWEEIIEKDFEILTYKGKMTSSLYCLNKKGKYTNGDKVANEAFLLEYYVIYSIKRLSDNEIFTVDDVVQLNDTWGYDCKIKEINIYNNRVSFTIEDTFSINVYSQFKEFKKIKQPLFTTDDGINVFGGETLYYIRKNDFVYQEEVNISKDATSNQYWWSFSTKKKAEEYRLNNKPCLSLKEVLDIVTFLDRSEKALKELVKSKL